MKKILKFVLTMIVITQPTIYTIGCDETDINTFKEISGITGKISSIAFDDSNNDFFVASTNREIYQINNQQSFKKLNISDINVDFEFSNLIVDNGNNLFVATKFITENEGGIYKYNKSSKKFEEFMNSFFDSPVMSLLFSKNNNTFYAAVEETLGETTVYKFNDNNEEPIKIGIIDGVMTVLNIDSNNNVYVGMKNGKIFKSDSKQEQMVELVDLKGIISALTTHNNKIYVVNTIDKNSTQLYQATNDNDNYKNIKFVETKVKTDWTINSIIIDDNNHLYVGGNNNNIYATSIDNDFNNLTIFSNQQFTNIYSLAYNKNILFVGSDSKVFIGKTNEFKF